MRRRRRNFDTPIASDNCPGTTVTVIPASGSFFPVGTTPVTATATDAAGNTDVCSFTVTVTGDDQPPTLTCPLNITISTDQCGAEVSYSTPISSDNCPGTTVTVSPESGSFFPVGTTTVTATATDAAGNTDVCTFTVTVNGGDVHPPTLASCPENITVSTDQCGAVVTYFTPVSSDNCPGATVTVSPESGSFFPPGTTTVIATATDAAGNTSSCTFTVTVNDNQAPVPPELLPITGQCSVTPPSPVAQDNCAGPIVGTTTTPFPITAMGTTVITWTFNDGNGNGSTVTQNVIITAGPACTVSNIAINNVTQNELNSSTSIFTFTVSLSTPAGAAGVSLI